MNLKLKLMRRQLVVALIFILSGGFSFGQNINLSDKLPMDPAVKVGKLSNGITYYIRKNVEPQNRAELRLVMKAGSILETEEQRGLAHFMEHMNFNGTKNFPKNELVNFLEKSGIKFGADLNAYTSFDETVYMLPVPTDTLEKFEKYLSVLADWSGNATLDHTEIDKERGVVLEEARLRKGASQRMNEKLYPILFRGSKYADRLPIGKEEVIQNAPYVEFEKFKADWYRPNLQAVVAVGDFDPAVVEALIKKQFGGFENPTNEKVREKFTMPLTGGTDAIVLTDKEQPYTIVQVYALHPESLEIDGKDRRESIVNSLFNSMMGQRLRELTQKADPPFLFGNVGYNSFLAGTDVLNMVAVAKGNDVEKALTAVVDESQRALKFGFTQSELDRAKLSYKTGVEKQFAERDKTNSEAYVGELVQCFLDDVVMTDIAYDKMFLEQYLDGIKLEEINNFAKTAFSSENRVVSLMGPEKDKETLPTTEKLIAILDNKNDKLEAYVDEAVVASLVGKMPIAGKVVSEKSVAEVGVTELVLSNGVKVNLKPTDFKNDEILFRANSWGGSSLYADSEADDAGFSSFVASQSGNGNLSNTQLTKFMSGKIARVNFGVSNIGETISGSCSPKDLETALQMVYNKFTNNNLDKEVVAGSIANQLAFLKNLETTPTPEKVYGDTLQSVLSDYNFRSRPMTSERFEKINPEKAMEIFNERFKNAADFEFTFVGNFDVAKITPLLATYLGGLPATAQKEQYVDLNIDPPAGIVNKVVKKGTEDKATVTMVMSGDYELNDIDEDVLSALGDILRIKLTEKLREEVGGVYSPYAGVRVGRFPSPEYSLTVRFGCAPANVDKLVALTLEEIKKIRENGATKEDIEKYINNEKLNFETNLKTNNFWLSSLASKYQKGEDIKTILERDKVLAKVTVENTKAVAKKYFSGDDLITVTLLPEN